jgi:hypothetical protein
MALMNVNLKLFAKVKRKIKSLLIGFHGFQNYFLIIEVCFCFMFAEWVSCTV